MPSFDAELDAEFDAEFCVGFDAELEVVCLLSRQRKRNIYCFIKILLDWSQQTL